MKYLKYLVRRFCLPPHCTDENLSTKDAFGYGSFLKFFFCVSSPIIFLGLSISYRLDLLSLCLWILATTEAFSPTCKCWMFSWNRKIFPRNSCKYFFGLFFPCLTLVHFNLHQHRTDQNLTSKCAYERLPLIFQTFFPHVVHYNLSMLVYLLYAINLDSVYCDFDNSIETCSTTWSRWM